MEELGIEYPDKSVTIEWMLCDLSSFRSVKEFVTAFKERKLNCMVNNYMYICVCSVQFQCVL